MALNNSDIIQSIINGTTSDATITPSSNDSLQQTKADRISELLAAKQTNVHKAKASILDQVLQRKFAPKIQPSQPAGLTADQQRVLAIQAEERRNALINAPQNLSAEEQWQKTLSIPPKPSEGEIAAVNAFNTAAGNAVSNVVKKLELDDFAGSVRRDAAATALEQQSKQQQKPEQKVFDFDEYRRLVIGAESGGQRNPNTARNPNSTATGTHQFTESTWAGLMVKHPNKGLTADGRTDPEQSKIAGDLLAIDDKDHLESKNIPVTNGSMYVMHTLGAGDGSMMLQAAMNGDTRLAADLVRPEVVTSNPTWFRGNPTPQGLVDHLSGLVGARITDQGPFTTTGDKIPTKQVAMSEAGKRLAEAFEKKDRGSPITGSPTERLEAMQAAEDAKAKLKGPMVTDVAKDLLRKGYTKAGELHKAYEEYQKKEESKKEPEFITPRPSSREPHYTDIGSEDFANVELPSFDDSASPGFDDAVLKPFAKPTFDTKTEIISKNEETGVIEYKNNVWGYEDPYTGQTVTGLNKVAAEAYAMHALTDTEAQMAGAPEPGSVEHAFNKATKEFGPVAATMAKAVNRVIGGPTTLNQLADSNNISPEDVVRYKVISKAPTLTTEQQTFKDSDTYKTLAKLESKAAHNLETSKLLDEFAEQWKKHFPTNERNPRGALKAYHLIAESEGTIAAVMNALKNDKASLIDMGWSSVPYTLALALGNIPVQLGLFTTLAVGMAEEAIIEWKAGHDGEEPSPEIAQEIMLLAGVRLAAEKASVGVLTTFLGKIPGLGGPLVWSRKVNKAVTKTVSPQVTGLKTFSQKYLGGPAKKVIKGAGAVAKVPFIEGSQEAFDEWVSGAQQGDAPLFSKERWTADPSQLAHGFLLGSFGVVSTGAGVKVFDIATKTAIKITDAFKTEGKLQEFNDKIRKLHEDNLAVITDKLQKIEDYKNTDPKVIKDFETVESELKDFAAIARDTPPEIGPNGELITDNTYFKEQFLTYELQILKGELTPQEALDEIYTNFNSEFETKQALYDNLKAQIPETLAYKDTVPGQFDVAKLKKVQAEIAKIEVDTKLSDEEKELASRDLREEEQRLFTKLDSPANVDIAAIEAERLQTLKENTEKLLESRDYEHVIAKTGLFKKGLKTKGDLKKQEKKKGESISEDEFTTTLNEIVVEGEKLFQQPKPKTSAVYEQRLKDANKSIEAFEKKLQETKDDASLSDKEKANRITAAEAILKEKREDKKEAEEGIARDKKKADEVQGTMTLTLSPPIVEGVELVPPDIGYANIDPSGRFKVGDIVQIDSQDPEILASQGFKIEYFLSEQERDGKVHVKLKGRSATIPIDQLYEVARPKATGKTPLTREEQLAELSKRDLTEDQQKRFNKVIEKEIADLKQRAGEATRILGSSADSFENISDEKINPTSSLQEKSEDSTLPEVARQFYKAEINRRRIKAERTATEQLAPSEKSLGIVKGEILEGQSAQWKGLYTYYQEILDAYSTLKDDIVVRDQQIAALRSNMSTHANNLNRKLAAFQTAQNTVARDGFKDNSPFAVAVIGTPLNPDTRDMQYDVVTNMTAKEIEDARADGKFITNIGPQSKNLVDALAAEVEYGNYIMEVVEGYANTPMAAKAASKKEQLKREQGVLNRLIKLYANQPKKRKEMSDEDIASLGVDSPIVKGSRVQWNVGKGFEGEGGIEVVDKIIEYQGKDYAKLVGTDLTVPVDELILVEDEKGPTLQEQLKTATDRATELLKISEEELTEEEANELKELKSEIGDLTLKINQEGKQPTSSKGSKFKGKGSSSKKSPPGSDEVAPDVRIRSIIKRNIKESIITVKNLKIVKTFIEGAKETYNYIVGDSLDEVLGLSRALFTDLVQIGSSEKLIKGINTLQDTDFNNDASLKEALMDLGVKPESADILIDQYNDFQGRYDQIIHRDLQQKDRDGNPTKVYYVGDPGDKEIYEVQVLTTNKEGAFEETGEYTKLEGGKVVLRSELMSAEIHALHMPLTPLLRKDELDPDNVNGRLPDQVIFTLMLSAMTFKQQSPNNNRWGDKPFAKEAFLFGGKNQSLMPDEQQQVDQIGYGFHDSAGRMGTAAIQLLEMSAKKIAEDSAIDQAGADLYFDHLGPALGMMAITIADGDSKYFDVNKHIWDFKEPNKPNRVFNNAPEGSTIGYKHITVRDKTYPNKDVRNALANIIEVSGVDLDISSGPLQKPAKVSKQIKNTFSRVDDEGDVLQALEELNNTVWRKNKAMDVVSDLREHREALYELSDVIRIYGTEEYVDTADNNKIKKRWQRDRQGNKIPLHHKDRMLSLTSSNTNKTNTIDELIAAYDLKELDNFHIAYELQNHHRLMQTGRINPQQSKITRSLVESWKEQEYTLENLWQFKMAVAYNFGIKTDKQYSFNTEFDFDNNIIKKESVLRAIASLQLLNTAKNRKKKSDKEIKLAASQLAKAMRDVKKDFPKGDMSLLNGIVGLSEYMKVKADKRFKLNYRVEPVLEGPKKKESFGSSLIYEIDGMSNGWAMNVVQFPMWEKEELWRRMGQVGNYQGKPGTFPFHDVMSPGPYNDLVELVNKGTTLENAWKYYKKNSGRKAYSKLAPKYKNRKDFNEKFTQINSALTVLYPDFKDQETLRDVVKYPFIMKMYGGGIKRISGDVTTDIIKELTTTIGEVQKVYAELKKSEPDPALIAKLRDEYNFFKDKEFGEHSAQEYYERSVVNLAEHLDTLGAFDKSTKIKGVTSKAEFLTRMKQNVFTNANSTAFDTQLNTEKLQAVISTTIAPRLEFGLNTLLEDTKEPRDAIVEMGEILHEVFMAHYEKAYKDKLAEVNEELATKHKLGTLIDSVTGKKFDKAPQRDSLTKLEIRNLIQDTNGDLIKVYPQFAGPLSRIAPEDDYNLGFVDLTNTEFIRDTDKIDQKIGDSPRITSEEVVVQYNDPNTKDKVNTVRTTTNQLQFIKPGVAALIREIINIDAAILTASIIKRDTNKFMLPTHDGVGSTPENLIPFAEDYNDFYKNFNLENSIISITLDQVEKVIKYSSNDIMDIVRYRLFNNSFNNQNKEKPEDKETLEQRLKVLKAIKNKVVKKQKFIQDGSTGQFVSAQMPIMRSPTEERENLSEETVENTLREQVRKSVEEAPKNPSPPKKPIATQFNDQLNETENKQIDDLIADETNDENVRGSFVPQGDTHVKSTRELDDITRNNFRGLFDQMSSLSSKYYSTKEEQDEHTQVLSSILNMLSDGFDETSDIQLTYQQIVGITQGTYEEAAERMTISVSQGGPLTRNGQSPAEVYVHEMLHAMTSIAASNYPLVAGRIDKLYDEVSASLTKTYGKGKEWRVFLPAGTSPVKLASQKEIDMAKAQYKYVFQGKEQDRIHEFLAYAATNRNLAAFMKKTTRPGRTTLLGKVLETIEAIVNTIREMLGHKVYKATSSSSFAEAIAITEKLVAVQNKHKSKHKQIESKFYQGLDAVDEIARDFANTVGINILKATVDMDPNTASKNPMSNLATGVINAPFLALSDDAASLSMRQAIDAGLNKTLRGIAHEVGGGALSPQLKEQLLQSKINISKQRQESETFYTNWFKNIWKSIPPKDMDDHGMSFETREALTDVLLKTDLSSLKLANLGFMGPGSTQRIMDLVGFDTNNIQARGKLKNAIKRKLRLSGSSPAIQYAEELGQWIATGKRGKLGNPYTNAYSIAFDHIEDPSEEQTNLLDAYATIVSLGKLDENSVSLVKNLSNNEFSADATNNGIIDMLDTHVVYKTKSRKDLFDGDPIQMVKGYIVERMDNLTSIKLGPASDKDKEAGLGYKDSYPLGKVDKDQTFDTLYINRNIPEVADISGIMSTTNQRNMGTTLTEILMRNPAYQYPNTDKPNFKKITAKIEEIKIRQADLAKQLKYDPNFSKFTPVRDQNNRITDYRVMMDHQSTKEILRPDLEIQNVFAHMQSRLVDRVNSIENDIQTINLLVHEQADLLKNHRDQFVNLLDENSAYIDRYRKMPRVIREYINKFAVNGEFMVREDIIDKVFGYTQLDVTQLKMLQGKSYGAQKAKQIAGLTHHLIRETVGYGKNRVVLAIPQVVVGNLFSNIAQLSMRKIPIQYIFYKIIEGIQQYRKYSKDRRELAKLEHLIETKRLNPKTSAEALQVERLKVRIKNNKLHKMSQAGLNSLIVEDLNEAQIDGYFNRMKRVLFKGKYKHIGDRIPRTVQSIAATLFFAKGSVPYEMSRQLVQMTDFLGRYVMIEHAVQVKGRDFKEAMHESLDAFVLFDEALLGPLEAVDAVGVTSFLSYWLRNQRAVNQLVKTSPTSVALSALTQHITGVPTLGNVNSAWLGGDFSPNLMQFDDLFDEANNVTGFEVVSDITKMLS